MPILQTEPHTDTVTIASLKVGYDVFCEKFPEEKELYIGSIKGNFALCLALSPSRFIEEIPLDELHLKGEVGRGGTH